MAQSPLKVVIIGAGIAGLAAGAMLREFAEVTIVESASELKEIGAAVTLGPGVVTILRRFGIHLENEGGIPAESISFWNSDGNLLTRNDFKTKELVGEHIISIHRADLHSALLRAATCENGPGVPCKILLEHKLATLDAERGVVTTKNGASLTGDIVVAADGIRSSAQSFILDEDVSPEPSGESAYRMLIRAEDLQAANHPVLVNGALSPTLHQVYGPKRKLIMYPIRGGSLLNIAAFVPDDELHEPVSEKWTSKGSIEAMVKSHEDFSPFWKDILSMGKEVGIYQLRDLLPLKNWVKGRAILIGDAAHPMLPHQAAGAMSAIEDAEALSFFLRGVTADKAHDALLKVYRLRYKRTSMCQAMSRDYGVHAKPNKTRGEEILRLWLYPGAESWATQRPDMVLDG